MPGGTRCPEALVAGRPTKPFGTHECSKESGPRSAAKQDRSSCVAPLLEQLWESMWPFSGGHILEKGSPRDRPRMCSKSFILWQNLTWQNPASISRIYVCLTSRPVPGGPRCRKALVAGRPSLPGGPRWEALLPGGPRCREALVAGKPSLPGPRCRRLSLPGGPRCREALVAGRPSLPGGPRCREALVAGRPSLPGGPRCREALAV